MPQTKAQPVNRRSVYSEHCTVADIPSDAADFIVIGRNISATKFVVKRVLVIPPQRKLSPQEAECAGLSSLQDWLHQTRSQS